MPSSSTDSSSKTSRPRFERITYGHYLFGFWAREGNRAVEVIQCDPDEWMWFATIDDRVCRSNVNEEMRMSKAEAMAWARKFLAGNVTPETWPTTWRIPEE